MGTEKIYSKIRKLTHVFIGCLVESHEESVKSSQSHNRPECEEANENFQNSEFRLRNSEELKLGNLMLQLTLMILVIPSLLLGTSITKVKFPVYNYT